MANLTLSLDDQLLQKARETALHERTSVNALVRDYLAQYVDSKSRRLGVIDALDSVARRSKSCSTDSWSREDLHLRHDNA